MRRSMPTPIGGVIAEVLRDLGLGNRMRQVEVLDRWSGIVGEQIARVAVAERIADGRLYVRVSGAPWRNELVFLKKDLIDRINGAMEETVVRDIIFH